MAAALGRKDAEVVLRDLEERKPHRSVDALLVNNLREELRTVARCKMEAKAEMQSLRSLGRC